jgi:RNase H-like domain found in reverse transcriptase/Reverse transcriptase (RNA-dependent DNA polymerase)/Integrase zinc binding domain/Chromo (CHRromatin Organisation MOdifier) domain/Retroviral aspartyl protease
MSLREEDILGESKLPEKKPGKRIPSVGAGRPTDQVATGRPIFGTYAGSLVPTSASSDVNTKDQHGLITFVAKVKGFRPLNVLVDCGATQNFLRRQTLDESEHKDSFNRNLYSGQWLEVRLATGKKQRYPKISVDLCMKFEGFEGTETLYVVDLDQRFDAILGMPWLAKHQPCIDWRSRSVIPTTTEADASINVKRAKALAFAADLSTEGVAKPSKAKVKRATSCAREDRKCLESKKNSSRHTKRKRNGARRDAHREDVPRRVSEHPGAKCGLRSITSVEKRTALEGLQGSSSSDSQSESHYDQSPECDCKRYLGEVGASPIETSVGEVGASPVERSVGEVVVSPKPDERRSAHDDEQSVLGIVVTEAGPRIGSVECHAPPKSAQKLLGLPSMEFQELLQELHDEQIDEICLITNTDDEVECNEVSTESRVERYENQGWDALKSSPFYELLWEFRDVFPDEVPSVLPKDKGIRHEIDLVPGTKYCVTRQWPLPREQVEVIDEFFRQRQAAGQVRESKSPHSSPTFCVRKATGGWRIVHAFNKLNAATIPAQTPIPRKDMIIDSMEGSTIFSTIDLRDGFYQVLMREADIPLTAVSTPSGMLWEWLVMPQGLRNAPATFNRCVSHLLRSVRHFAPSYFDDIFIHSRAMDEKSEVEVHMEHLRELLILMRQHKLYANIKKCVFGADEIPVLGCFVGKNGVRSDPEKVRAISEWPVPNCAKDLRKWLGLANYLHKYCKDYAALTQPLTGLLKKNTAWIWRSEQSTAFEEIKRRLLSAPVLKIADPDKPFFVVCDASDFAVGAALLQCDDSGVERVIAYVSRQLKAAEKNYPVHDKELLAMKFALVKFRVHLLGSKPFTVFTDHASLRTAVNSPHLSARMARWLSFFAEYNFRVEYKPGKQNVIADALSRRPDYEEQSSSLNSTTTRTIIWSDLHDRIRRAYADDEDLTSLIQYFRDATAKVPTPWRTKIHKFVYRDELLWYIADDTDHPRVVVPKDEDLRADIIFEYHNTRIAGHLGREKTYLSLSRDFWWNHQYKLVKQYVKYCEICQRVKPQQRIQAPLQSLPIPTDCWQSVSLDFVFGLPPDDQKNTGVVVFVDRFSKMVHLAPVRANISARETAKIFFERVFAAHGMPRDLVSDRDPRFTASLWQELFSLCDTRLKMSTADHPQTDGQTERVNRVLVDMLKSFCSSDPKNWSRALPMLEFAMNNSVHSSTGFTPFYMNHVRHPHVPSSLSTGVPNFGGGRSRKDLSSYRRSSISSNVRRKKNERPNARERESCKRPNACNSKTNECPSTRANNRSERPNARIKRNHECPSTRDETALNEGPDPREVNQSECPVTHFAEPHECINTRGDTELDEGPNPRRMQSKTNERPNAREKRLVPKNEGPNPRKVKQSECLHTHYEDKRNEGPDPRKKKRYGCPNTRKALGSNGGPNPRDAKCAGVEHIHTHTCEDRDERSNARRVKQPEGREFLEERFAMLRRAIDQLNRSQEIQAQHANKSRNNFISFKLGDKVLLATKTLPEHAVSCLGSRKLLPRFIGPFRVTEVHGKAYTLDIPSVMKTHPTFYVGCLKPYQEAYHPPDLERFDRREGDDHEDLPVVELQPGRQEKAGSTSLGPRSPEREQATLSAPGSIPVQQKHLSVDKPPRKQPRSGAPRRKKAGIRIPAGAHRAPPPLRDARGNTRWIVDHLVDRRSTPKGVEYLVRWTGCPPSSDSWEPRGILLEDVPDLVREFDSNEEQQLL